MAARSDRWYVDDRQVFQVTPPRSGWYPMGYDIPFLYHPEPGGWWRLAGLPDSTTVFPQQLQVIMCGFTETGSDYS